MYEDVYIQYDKLSTLTPEQIKDFGVVYIVLDETNKESVLTSLMPRRGMTGGIICWERVERYNSLKEIATLSMKELLTRYAKQYIIKTDSSYYVYDDPKLHSFLSKLTYTGIETVCKNLDEFAEQFKKNNITLRLPRISTARKKTRPNRGLK